MIQNGSSEDTIAAIATPVGQAGIGIIRISGPRSLEIARKVFCPKKDIQTFESHRLYLGHVKDPASGRVLDEVLISFMKAPHTYTREDVVEINCHSGYLLLAKVLEIILNQGARLAKPGEFTYRAFMNNRIDLTQAEAVVDLINSHSERGLQLASEQIKGGLRTQIRELREKALEILASIEVAIDFPDEEVEFLPRDKTADKIEGELIEPIEKILAAYVQRKIWMEGIRTVIVGRVNAGKSSLLNRLLNEERAIVTPIPGTTRDVIESTIYIEGLPLRLIDTAGFRKVKGRLEGIGIRLTHKKWAEADLALVVIDQSRPVNRDDLDLISKSREKKSLILLNKSDLPGKISEERLDGLLEGLQVVRISALTGEGIDDLRRAIRDLILSPDTDIATSLSVAPNLRHKQALQKAGQFFKTSAQNARNGLPLEIIAMDINSALEALAEITGEITTDDLLDKIFSQFCLGK
ncbi:MAG: tRNA uridine-5-carboxymethylaminomethyl(34) synthesis GTPase MnmE [Deltaproteobacteria bacterium]|nr:tRNA uridine-5-carboxymethylaminomethyl(34) synthesis GTPase MnmE [Deltaproteobacteria bacterium]MBW2043655.1 tRNA uridine-5-carboxymethylaminomethyl(34) synthesis GTPase MnmE [Deltaproteobacteria bacterium]MBW2300473.1 tRNA uridine-5-carboxymethylaminomethyl(34) synthesis GTPase MnmE [Deltaproteobacteria bacterium]